MRTTTKRCVFLDRDGTLVKAYPNRPANCADEIVLLPGVPEGISIIQSLDLLTVVVTNQGGVALGYTTSSAVHEMHARLDDLLITEGCRPLDAYFHCPHKPDDGCLCRKPKTQMVRDAISALNIQLDGSYIVGDDVRDMQLGIAAGIKRRFMVVSDRYIDNDFATMISSNFLDVAKAIEVLELNGKK